MKKIGVLAFLIGPGGVSQYAKSMVDALVLDNENEYILFTDTGNTNYDDYKIEKRKVNVFGNSNLISNIVTRILAINIIELAMLIGRQRPLFMSRDELASFSDIDLFITPTISYYPHFYIQKPFIMTFHDVQEKYYPEFFTIKQRIIRYFEKRLVRYAAHIITESNYNRSDLIKFFNINPENISVLPSPPPLELLNSEYSEEKMKAIKLKYGLPDNYIFYPAQYWYHKNHIKLLEAFKMLSEKYPDLHLVFTGTKQNNYKNVVIKLTEYGLEGKVLRLGYIDYKDMPGLYMMSKMLVMPTLFESVSMPIYESFMLKVPVCCSNVVALPEQVGDAGLLFNPNDPADIAEKIQELLDDDELRNRLAQRGYERLKNFDHKNYENQLKIIIRKVSE